MKAGFKVCTGFETVGKSHTTFVENTEGGYFDVIRSVLTLNLAGLLQASLALPILGE